MTSGFNFWNPLDQYDWAGSPYYGSPVEKNQANQNPSGAYLRAITAQGFGGVDQPSDWARSLENRFQQGYSAAQLTNPELNWEQYLGKSMPDLRHLYLSMDPQSRGVNSSPYVGGARWLKRSD